jgi:predicted nucleic acid-binding protein
VPCITFVTYGELTQWMRLRSWGERNRTRLQHWMDSRPVLAYNRTVASVWGELSAACCIVVGLPLVTLNTKDYVDFAEYHGLVLF